MNENLTEQEYQDQLLENLAESQGVNYVESFAEAGVLTYDKGVIVHLENGQEFYLTIQQR